MEILDRPFERFRKSDPFSFPPCLFSSLINESEETLMISQARLAHLLKKATANRLLPAAQSSTPHSSYPNPLYGFSHTMDAPKELVLHEEQWIVKLTDVAIFPSPRTGETVVGTLEAHLNGFRFIYTSSNSHLDFMHTNVEKYFYRLGDDKMPPLMQFHLYDPIVMGNRETKDIQFCLLPTPLGQVTSHNDSDNIDEYKQTRDISCRNEDLKHFVHRVPEAQRTCRKLNLYSSVSFEELDKFEFYGTFPTGAPAIFTLTKYLDFLVVLKGTLFFVTALRDIEIVNLAHSAPDGIDMTIVFKDFDRDVLEICSIPLESLTRLKHRLNSGSVKYYVNSFSLNWSLILRDIIESPKKFIDNGGWESLCLEDSLTAACYPYAIPDEPRWYPMIYA